MLPHVAIPDHYISNTPPQLAIPFHHISHATLSFGDSGSRFNLYLKHVPLSGDSPQHAPSLSDSRPIIWRFRFIMYLDLPCHLYFRKR